MANEPLNERVEIACPECSHVQSEPALVVSTQCRSCLSHYQVVSGKAVAKLKSVARPPQNNHTQTPTVKPKNKPTLPPRLLSPQHRPFWLRIFFPIKPPREAKCFSCDHRFQALAKAQSSQCPKCGTYVSLIDHDITDHCKRIIQTCGNVSIKKTGTFTGQSLTCYHLTLMGKVLSPIHCIGDLIIRSDSKFHHPVTCRNLRIINHSQVEFLYPVVTETASIDGQVRGQITCSGTLTLEKKSTLSGLLCTSSLVAKKKAKHIGTIEWIKA